MISQVGVVVLGIYFKLQFVYMLETEDSGNAVRWSATAKEEQNNVDRLKETIKVECAGCRESLWF